MKNPLNASRCSVQAGGHWTETDIMKLIVAFRNFVNTQKYETLKCYWMMVAKQYKYVDEEMDHTSELVYHSVTVFFHPICYLKT